MSRETPERSHGWRQRKRPAIRAAMIPLVFYLAIALVLPAARGAAAKPEFWTHALQVAAVTGVVFALFSAAWLAWPGGRG